MFNKQEVMFLMNMINEMTCSGKLVDPDKILLANEIFTKLANYEIEQTHYQKAHELLTDVFTKLENNYNKESTHVDRKNSHSVG